jgi:hypothetical protein
LPLVSYILARRLFFFYGRIELVNAKSLLFEHSPLDFYEFTLNLLFQYALAILKYFCIFVLDLLQLRLNEHALDQEQSNIDYDVYVLQIYGFFLHLSLFVLKMFSS